MNQNETRNLALDVEVTEDSLEYFLSEDLVFVQYFNNFLSLPAFSQRLTYNIFSGCFEEFKNILVNDNNGKQAPSLKSISKSDTDENRSRISYYVKFLDKQQGLDWVKKNRFPLFLKSEIYADYKLSKLLSESQVAFLNKLLNDGYTAREDGLSYCSSPSERSAISCADTNSTTDETASLTIPSYVDGKDISNLPKWQQKLYVNSLSEGITQNESEVFDGKKVEECNQDGNSKIENVRQIKPDIRKYVDETIDSWKKKYCIKPHFARQHSDLGFVEEVDEEKDSEYDEEEDGQYNGEYNEHYDGQFDEENKPPESSSGIRLDNNELVVEATPPNIASCDISVQINDNCFFFLDDNLNPLIYETNRGFSAEKIEYFMNKLTYRRSVEDVKSCMTEQQGEVLSDCDDADITEILLAVDQRHNTQYEKKISDELSASIFKHPLCFPLNLSCKQGLDAFKEFLFGTPGEKNLLLWLDVERARHLDQVERERMLRNLKDRFIRSGAPYEVPTAIRKSWGLTDVTEISMERLIFVRKKIVDPLLKYWCPRFTYHQYHEKKKYYNELCYHERLRHESRDRLAQRPMSCVNHLRTESKISSNGSFTDADSGIFCTDQLERLDSGITRKMLRVKSAYPRLMSAKSTQQTNAGSEQLQLVSSFHDGGFGFKPPVAKYFHNDASNYDHKNSFRLYIQPVPTFPSTASNIKSTPNFKEEEDLNGCTEYDKKMDFLVDVLLHEKHTGNYFLKYLEQQNVKLWLDCYMFWNALQEYTEHFFADVFTPLSVKRKANYIYTAYVTSKGEHDLQCSVDVQTKIFKQLDPPYEDLFDCVEQRALDILLQPCLQLSMKERLNYKQLKPEEELKYIEVNRKWRYEDNSTSDELVDASITSCDEEEDKISPDEVDTPIPSSKDGVDFEGLLKNKTELEYFQSFLESRHRQGIIDLTAWTDMELFRRLPQPTTAKEQEERDRLCIEIREKWLNKSYFFGSNSPASKEAIKQILELAGGVKALPSRPSSPVILETQKYARGRVERRWMKLYKETKEYKERKKKKSCVAELVEDLVMKKKLQRSEQAWRLLNSRWNAGGRDVAALRKALSDPGERELFRRFISIHGDMMENNLNFWLEVQKYKELCHNHVEGKLIKRKIQTIIDVFIKSSLPPELQVDIPIEIAERLYDKACGRPPQRGPYLFREAQATVFRLLYNFWKEYSIFRSQLDDGVNPAQSLQNLQKQHADDVTRKKMLIERRRLSKLINEKKKKREYIPKERSKPADLISYMTKTIESNADADNDRLTTSFAYSKYIAKTELKSLEARMKKEGISLQDVPESNKSDLLKDKPLGDNTSEISVARKSFKSTFTSDAMPSSNNNRKTNQLFGCSLEQNTNRESKPGLSRVTSVHFNIARKSQNLQRTSTCGKSTSRLDKSARKSEKKNFDQFTRGQLEVLQESKKTGNRLTIKSLKEFEQSEQGKPLKDASVLNRITAPLQTTSDVMTFPKIEYACDPKSDVIKRTVKNLVVNPRLPRNAGTASILKKIEKERPRVESPPPKIMADVVVC